MNKTAIIGIFIIAIMFVSTFSYGILQSVRSTNQLPKSNILNYELTPQLRDAFVYYGATVLRFEYSSNCDNCFDQKGFLENMANTYKETLATDFYNIYLEEILNETIEPSQLTIESKLGNRTIIDPTDNITFNALCDLMFAPPTICATR